MASNGMSLMHPALCPSEAQKNYSISESEGLAVCWAVRKWRCFLHSSNSAAIVVTDHSCLKNLIENRRLNRYAVELSEHNLKVVYRKGSEHHLPDLLSRMARTTSCSIEAKRLGNSAAGCTVHAAAAQLYMQHWDR